MSRRDETASDAIPRVVVARAHRRGTGTTMRGTRVAPRTIRRCVTASRPMEAANAAAANVWLIVASNARGRASEEEECARDAWGTNAFISESLAVAGETELLGLSSDTNISLLMISHQHTRGCRQQTKRKFAFFRY